MTEDVKSKIRLQKSTFTVDVLKMALAPLCTQILGIILMPIITRLYAPDTFGLFQLYAHMVMPISVFVTMGYCGSIVLPQKDEEAANMFCICLAFTALSTVLTVPFIWASSGLVLRWLKAPELSVYLWWIPINVFAIGLFLSLRFWNVRLKQFGRIAISNISDFVMNKCVLIGAGFSGFATAGSLIIGSLAGSMTMSGILGGRIWHESGQLFKQSIRWDNLIQGIKRYRKFPIYNLPTDLLGRFSDSLAIFLFSFYFSKSVIGYYGLGLAILAIPTTFIGSSIAEVFYQKGVRARYEGTNAVLVENLFKEMTRISMLPFLVLAILGDCIFAFIFGANWATAGAYAQILSLKIFIIFIMNPATCLPNILEKQEFNLFLRIVTIITSFISITVGGLLKNVYISLSLLSLLDSLVFLGYGILLISFAGVALSRVFGILLKCFISCMPVIITVMLAKYCFRLSPLLLIIISVTGCIIYYAILLKEDKVLRSMIMMFIRQIKPKEVS